MKQSNPIIEIAGNAVMCYGLYKLAKMAISEFRNYRSMKRAEKEKEMESQLPPEPPKTTEPPPIKQAEDNGFQTEKHKRDKYVELDLSDLRQKEYTPNVAEVKDINGVKDIETLYAYLMYLRSQMPKGKIADSGVSLLVRELDTFISTRMIDLREARGLICTDGISLLQYTGEELKPTGFILTKMKSVKSIPDNLFKKNEGRFHKMWDRATWKWIVEGGPRRFRSVFFGGRKWSTYRVDEVISFRHRYGCCDVGLASDDPKDFLHDPAVYLRVENNYPMIDSMDKIISDMVDKDTRRFNKSRVIVGVSDFGEVFVLNPDPFRKMMRLVPFSVLKAAMKNVHCDSEGPFVSILNRAVSKIDGHIDRLLSYDGDAVTDRTLGLRFFEI